MSFLDCIQGKVNTGLVTKAQQKSLMNKFESLKSRYMDTMGNEQAAAKAAADIVEAEARLIADKKQNTINHALAQERVNAELDEAVKKIDDQGAFFKRDAGEKYGLAIQDKLEKANQRGKGVHKQLLTHLEEFIDTFRSKLGGLRAETEGIEDVIREVLGESTGSVQARSMGQALRNVFDLGHARFKSAGGIIGKIDNYFPQTHSRSGISAVEFEDWYKFFRPLLKNDEMIDRATGLPFTETRLKQVMKDDYDDITTGGKLSLLRAAEKGKQIQRFGGDVSQRRTASRFYIFKDADSFLEYNKKFGTGTQGLFDMATNQIEAMSRDIGTLETFGPKPDAILRHLDLQMSARGTTNARKKWAAGMYDVLTGRTSGDVGESWWSNSLGHVQNWLRSAYLGSAPISAISDTSFVYATARLNGLSGTKSLVRYLKQLNPTSKVDRRIANRSGYIAEITSANSMAASRFTGESLSGKRGITSKLAEFTNRASGLQAMTKGAADAIALEAEGALADFATSRTTWGNLPKELREALESFDIKEKDWTTIKKAELFEVPETGAKFLRSQEIATIKGLDPKEALDLATKMDTWIFSMRDVATNEPGLRTRAITTGAFTGADARRGTAIRALFSSAFMFKSFPITVLFNHVLPSISSARQGRLNHVASTFVGGTLMGAAAIQLKEIAKGREPKEFDNPRFWAAAMLQGGGAGLYGDFFFQDYSRFGREPITDALGGPIAGLADDVMRTFKGNLDRHIDGKDANFFADSLNLLKRNTPAVNLWYTRLLMERSLFDQLERQIDPKFDSKMRKMERHLLKQNDQQFWWRKGDKLPEGVR